MVVFYYDDNRFIAIDKEEMKVKIKMYEDFIYVYNIKKYELNIYRNKNGYVTNYDLYPDKVVFREFYGDDVFEYTYYFSDFGYVYREAI